MQLPSSDELPTRKKPKQKDSGLWLMSFSDMSMTLMCFFIVMLSFSKIDPERLNLVSGEPITPATQETQPLKKISEDLLKEIKKQKLEASVHYDGKAVEVEFADSLFFASGSASLNYNTMRLSGRIMRVIAAAPAQYHLTFEGHTDDLPLSVKMTDRFPSNWELSAARAVALLNAFKTQGVDENRMSVVAYAHTRPKVDPSTYQGKRLAMVRAQNRRVVIKIE